MTPRTSLWFSILIFLGIAAVPSRLVSLNEQTGADEEVIRRIEHEGANAAAHNDADAYGRILADDFVGHWADGSKTTKAEEIQLMRSGTESYTENKITELYVRIFGTTAIATGRNTETATIEGKDMTGVYSFTDVFLKRNGRWQIVASQTARPVPYGANCIGGKTSSNP